MFIQSVVSMSIRIWLIPFYINFMIFLTFSQGNISYNCRYRLLYLLKQILKWQKYRQSSNDCTLFFADFIQFTSSFMDRSCGITLLMWLQVRSMYLLRCEKNFKGFFLQKMLSSIIVVKEKHIQTNRLPKSKNMVIMCRSQLNLNFKQG